MEIKLNDQKLDVNFEHENTLGEVLAGLEQWLDNSGHRLTNFSIDGQNINASMVEEIFPRKIDTIKTLDIFTDLTANLSTTALITLIDDIKNYESANLEEKSGFLNNWKNNSHSQFISSEMADLYSLCVNTFSGYSSCETLNLITEERLREVQNPSEEFAKIEGLLNDICERLINLPLDIQTGKDRFVSETIQLFSGITEKIFRIFYQIESQGFFAREQKTENSNFSDKEQIMRQITAFGKILKEFLEAYEKNDSVLVGDIAEYETSPKLKELYFTIQQSIKTREKIC